MLVVKDLDNSIIDDNLLEVDDTLRFKNGRDGDHIMAPFQCDICHFQNLKGRNPRAGCYQDDLLLMCIQRVVLDSFWSRERSTVNSNRLEGVKFVELQETLGLKRKALPPQGPYSMEDTWGVNVACLLVMKLLL